MKKLGETLVVWFKVFLIVLVLFGGYKLYQRYTQDKLPLLQSKKVDTKIKVTTKSPSKTQVKVGKVRKTGEHSATIEYTVIPDPMQYQFLNMAEEPEIKFTTDVIFPHIQITHSVGVYRSPHATFVGFGQRLNSIPFTDVYINTMFLLGKYHVDEPVVAIGLCLTQEIMPHLSLGIGVVYSTKSFKNSPEAILGIGYGW